MRKLLYMLAAIVLVGAFFTTRQHASADSSSWQKAVNIQPQSSTDFASSSFQQSVRNAAADGVNYIYLVIPIHQSNIYSTDVAAGGDTPTDASLTSAVNYIHSLGLSAAFNIHDDPYDGQWRAEIDPSDRTTWFANYGSELNHYATLGKTLGTNEIVIGTEMTKMTDPSYSSTNTANWLTMIANVRSRYSGLLTYSAQHEAYLSDLQTLGFWSALDSIGVSAYYTMGNDGSSISSLEGTWDYWNNNSLKAISQRYNKPIIFTEVGYQSKSGALNDPGDSYANGGGVDLTDQANGYQALMSYWNNYSYFGGVAWWDWSSNPNAGGSNDTDYTPQNKPAEQIMKQWYTKSGTTTPTSPTAPTTPATYTEAATTNGTATVNNSVTLTATATASQSTTGKLVDVEVYNAQGQQVLQQAYDNQNLSTTPLSFNIAWTPTASGTYTIKMGVFNSAWQGTLYWTNTAGTITVNSAATVTPPTPTPTPIPTPTPTPTPIPAPITTPTPTAPAANSTIDIWWPSNGGTVSGVQPFKALIDGADIDSYTMYWQVGSGQLNLMNDNTNPIAHKESSVDLSGWNWSSNNQYVITFVAKNSAGTVIGQKSITITVSH
jgi:hypothetical protein